MCSINPYMCYPVSLRCRDSRRLCASNSDWKCLTWPWQTASLWHIRWNEQIIFILDLLLSLSEFCFSLCCVFFFNLTAIPRMISVFSFVKMLNHMMPQTWWSFYQGVSIASQTVSTLVKQRNRCCYGVVLWNTGLCLSHVTSHCRTWIYSVYGVLPFFFFVEGFIMYNNDL